MNLYISDTHFGHANVINFDHRPFADKTEMEHMMIELWNGRVRPDDDVWILGDICYRSDKDPSYYLRQLKGRKHLIIGNHDKVIIDSDKALSYFESVEKMQHIKDHDKNIIMCHFPIANWNGMHHGSYHIYGHIHGSRGNTYEFMKRRERAYNAGCMINNYTPVSFRELVENNKRFQEL